jgi:carboxyl-terminal processing protease
MDYDFFSEDNQKQEENATQRVPAPMRERKTPPQRKPKSVGKTILSIGLAITFFLSGMLTTWLLLDPQMRTLVSIKRKIQNNYYQEVSDEEFYKAIFGGINNNVLDAYSGYLTPEEFSSMIREMEGNRLGIGLVFAAQQTEPLRITRVCGNSPAEEAGVIAGETIIACGKTEETMVLCNTFEEFSNFLSGYGERETFFLRLHLNGVTRNVKLYKSAYVENYVFYRTNSTAYGFMGANAETWTEIGAPLSILDDDTAYIRLIQFTANASREFDRAMRQFKQDGKKHLILDLRENGGGYLETMQSIASYFCKTSNEKEPIVAVADFGEKRKTYRAEGNYYYNYFAEDSNIYVLADRYSASASECLLGVMLDYGAITYGDICLAERDGVAKTYGKGIMQETTLVNWLKQDAITLTTAEIRWPLSDNSIHGRGVLPTDGALVVAENVDYETETINAIKTLLG